MNDNQEAKLASIFEAVRIISANSFSFADGAPIDASSTQPEPDEQHAGQQNPIAPLVNALTNTLYSQCYAREFDGRTMRPAPDITSQDTGFVARLMKANRSRSRWDPEWTIYRLGVDGEVQVKKGERHRSPVPGEYSFAAGPGMRPQVGDSVSLQVLSDSHVVQPGMYYVFGETLGDQFDEFNLVRIYFHIAADAVPNLIEWLSTQLNRFQVPFQLKCQKRSIHYERLDAFVVYVARRFLEITCRVSADTPETTLSRLETAVPLFTKLFRPGIGLAEDPGQRRSFGMNRCQLLAEGIVDAWMGGDQSPEGRLAAVRRRFVANGLDLDRPHLNAGSADFELPLSDGTELIGNHLCETRCEPARQKPYKPTVPSRFLDAADRIGSRICRGALWAGPCCNWLGGMMDGSTRTPVYAALGPSGSNRLAGACLYEGTAGIALFLARLFAFSREAIHKRTLEGALNHVVGQLRSCEESLNIGYYTGLTGIAYTLIESGEIIEHHGLIERGINELVRLRHIRSSPRTVDVLGGSAGVIPVLIDVAERFGRSELIETAVLHGDHLLASADKSTDGWSWATNTRWVRNLTGQSHGTAGIAWSLLELHAATGDERFRAAAREALRYERQHFDAERRNWPDYRKLDPSGTWHEPRCTTAWCHGAPGIGTSRLRVSELLSDDRDCKTEIDAAIATTLASFRNPNNFSLCHGHSGNAELLLIAADQLNRPDLRQAAEAVGDLGIDRYLNTEIPWPCGLETVWETPTLMLGLAGIGYFYLRLHDPKNVKPILIIVPNRTTGQPDLCLD